MEIPIPGTPGPETQLKTMKKLDFPPSPRVAYLWIAKKLTSFLAPGGPPGGALGGKPKIDHETDIGLANGAEILHAPRYNLETRIPSSTAPGAQGNTVL